jgi:hypothetical protein
MSSKDPLGKGHTCKLHFKKKIATQKGNIRMCNRNPTMARRRRISVVSAN